MGDLQAIQPAGTPSRTLNPQVMLHPNIRQSHRHHRLCHGANGCRDQGAIPPCLSRHDTVKGRTQMRSRIHLGKGTGCPGAEVGVCCGAGGSSSSWGVPALQTWSPAWFEAPITPRSMSGEWSGVGNSSILLSSVTGVPVSPGFIPIPLLRYSSSGMGSRAGMQRGLDGRKP